MCDQDGQSNWQLGDLNNLKKCGEITASHDLQCFALNCRFCSGICLEFEVFMQHLREHHSKDILALYSNALQDEKLTENFDNLTCSNEDEHDSLGLLKSKDSNGILTVIKNKNGHSRKTTSDDITSNTTTLTYLPASTSINSSASEYSWDMLSGKRNEMLQELTELPYTTLSHNDETKKNNGILTCAENKPFIKEIKGTVNINSKQQNDSDGKSERTMMEKRKVLSCLIEAFQRQPALWNHQHADFKTCDRLNAYDRIAMELQSNIKVTLSSQACYLEIQKLCTRYRKELRLQHKGNAPHAPKLWFYSKFEFLREIFQHQITKRITKPNGVKECQQQQQNTYYKSKAIDFCTRKYQLKFIEFYKHQQTLWNSDHPDFRSTAFRNKAFNQILEQVNTCTGMTYTVEQVQKTILQLRKDFSVSKYKQLTEGLIDKTSNEETVSWAFLDPHVGPFWCTVCAKFIKTIDQYKTHKSQHDGSKPFNCPLCDKGFKNPGNLRVHLRRHNGDFPYACDQETCDKSFATSTEVLIHKRTHTGERPYCCDMCSKSFKTWSFFDIHRRTHLKQSTFHCPICDKGFYEKNRYTDHMNGHLQIRKHQCTECYKKFTTYANLKKHLELHLPIKKYNCDTCNKRFAQFPSLRWHRTKEHPKNQPDIEKS